MQDLPLRPENTKVRNYFRNMVGITLTRMFPGAQRNNTSRDSTAFFESLDFSMSTEWDVAEDNLIAGISTVED